MTSNQNEGEWQTAGQGGRRGPKRGEGPRNATNQNSRSVPGQAQRPVGQDSGPNSRGNAQVPHRGPDLANEPRSNTAPRQDNMPRNQGYGQSRPPQGDFNPRNMNTNFRGSNRAGDPAQPNQAQARPRGGKVQVQVYPGQHKPIPDPNQSVSKAEDEFIKSDSVPDRPSQGLCVRPGYGLQGDKTVLWTNYFELRAPSSQLALNYYTMTVDPDANDRFPKGLKRQQLMKLMLVHDDFEAMRPTLLATDFNTILITRDPLCFDHAVVENNAAKIVIAFRPEGMVQAPISPVLYTIRISQPTFLNFSDFMSYLNPSKTTSEYNKLPMSQALNTILGHNSKQSGDFVTIGSRKVYPFKENNPAFEKFDVSGGLIALRGFYGNVVGATLRVLVNVNICHGAFYRAVSLKNIMGAFRRNDRFNCDDLHRFVRKLRVSTTHLSPEHIAFGKIRTISGLAIHGDGAKQDNPPRIDLAIGGDPSQVHFHEDLSALSSTRAESSTNQGLTNQRKPASRGGKSRYITVKQFFEKTYPNSPVAQRLANEFPVVNVGTRAIPIYLPADVCVVQPGQLSHFKLNEKETSQMIRFSKINPDKCAKIIVEKGRPALGYVSPSGKLDDFGIKIGDELITVHGRILERPTIEYKARISPSGMASEPCIENPSQGIWNFKDVQLHAPKKIGKWRWARIAVGDDTNNQPPPVFEQGIAAQVEQFRDTLKNCGIRWSAPIVDRVVVQNFNTQSSELGKYLQWFKAQLESISESGPGSKNTTATVEPEPHPLLLVILPGTATQLYQQIKTFADTKGGFHTICVTGTGAASDDPEPYLRSRGSEKKFYGKSSDQYFANVALKLNSKLGGTNHILPSKETLGPIDEGNTMVVGIDVTHPSLSSKKEAPSIFALVASTDKHLSQWPAILGVQKKSREEVISDTAKLNKLFQNRLNLWSQRNGKKLPENIIVYRDGVSDSQYQKVLDTELKTLKEACRSVYRADETTAGLPRFTLIVVAKRHHTRFYPTKESQADSKSNAPCGTVVDRGITQARDWDFFLQSHSVVSNGTARPAHYVVLHDEVFAKIPDRADLLQRITYNMCYLHSPSTRAISICVPVYLADKACSRARLYLHDQFGPPAPGTQDDEDKNKTETEAQKDARLAEEAKVLESQQRRIEIHSRLEDSMFYI